MMYLYKIERTDEVGYDEYDSAVVTAKNAEDAKTIVPRYDDSKVKHYVPGMEDDGFVLSSWATPDKVTVTLIGLADEKYTEERVICASFNAG